MSRILVLGAAGMLGHKVCERLAGHEVVGTVRGPVDAYARYAEIFAGVRLLGGVDVLENGRLETVLDEAAPDFVVNCVGVVKQLEAAEDPYLSVAINSFLPHRLARLCERRGARLIHVSTDCVFDGERGGYRESDLTDARDLYGRSKALGETTPREAAAVTLRTSFIGRELKRPTHGLVEWFLAARGAVDGYARTIYSGLTSLELAEVIRRIVERHDDLTGLYQVGGRPISKYDLLALVRDTYGLEIEIRKADEPVSDRSLVSEAFAAATGYRAPDWKTMIEAMHRDTTPYESWLEETS